MDCAGLVVVTGVVGVWVALDVADWELDGVVVGS